MRVLMVSSNRVRQPIPVFPFGACLVAQAVARAGHEVRFLDLMFPENPVQALTRSLSAWSPETIGLSIRNIDTNDVWKPTALTDETALLADTIRQHSRATIVLGGASLGVMPRQILRRTGAPWAVLADGEKVFPELLAALQRGSDPAQIPGVLGLNGHVPARRSTNGGVLADCNVADFAHWVDAPRYLSNMATVPVQAKRGCPFECLYCTYNLAEGRDYRLLPPAEVVENLARLAGQGLRDIEFVDNVFNSPYEHALAICRELAASRLGLRLQSLELNPRFVSDELLEAMQAAGFVGIGVTAESSADGVLQTLRKGYSAADVRRAAEIVARHKIPCVWIFMLGAPGETQDSVRETLNFAAQDIRPSDVVFIQMGTRIYPGTDLEPLARAHGVLTCSPDEMLFPRFYLSPQVPLDWLKAEVNQVAAKHLNFIVGESISRPLLQKVLRFSCRLGFRPPLWRHTPAVRRVLHWLRLYHPGEIA